MPNGLTLKTILLPKASGQTVKLNKQKAQLQSTVDDKLIELESQLESDTQSMQEKQLMKLSPTLSFYASNPDLAAMLNSVPVGAFGGAIELWKTIG